MKDIGFKLYFYQNNKLFKKVAVKSGHHNCLVVGSGKDSHIKLDNNRVSRNHLQIIYDENGKLNVQDLGSKNGTFLNGIRIGENRLLKHKDKLQLAGVNDILIVVEKPNSNQITGEDYDLINKLKSKNRIFLGRSSDCDVILNYNTISKHHASITLSKSSNDNVYFLEDLNSTNGTFVNGRKIKGIKKINIHDKIYIGRFQLTLDGQVKNLNEELAITAIGIEKTYSNGYIGLKKMDLSIPSISITAIMGPSGGGKSTLLKALNGDTPPTKGKVYLFNQELSINWQYLKTQIGYVPQDDIVHQELTVNQSLFYTAKLRLENISDLDIDNKINQVLTDLNIINKKNNLISNLSGGQRKRVSIAVELMTDPLILFLDEPTSPLDPSTVEDFLGILRKLSEKGTTVLMVTHKPEDLEYMDEVIFMAEGGSMVYQGDAKRYKDYFNVKTAVSVFSQISGKSSKIWIDKYLNPRPLSKSISSSSFTRSSSEASMVKQFYWLTRRYFTIKINDKVNSWLMLLQAPIIAILICLIFKQITSAVLFMIAISAIWLGTQNAAREIVSENAIYKRERMFNLYIFPYIFSKITVLSFFSIIQSMIFMLILTIHYNRSSVIVDINDPVYLFFWMVFLSISATFLGLLLSSLVKTSERAMTILPLILLPQIMLAGLISKVSNGIVEFISYFTISRWGVEGFNIIQENIIENIPDFMAGIIEPQEKDGLKLLLKQFHEYYRNKDIFGELTGTLALDISVILIMVIVMTFLIFRILKNKDSIKIK
ncbi:FHA domain-containing protein [Flavobacteriaceae bacterium]|nr:FHA domain-containing protein [Flavobacteriaceae bacterium]